MLARHSWFVALVTLAFGSAMTPPAAAAQGGAGPPCVTGCNAGYSFGVTPDGYGQAVHPMNSTAVDTIIITNSGTLTDSYTVGCDATGTVTCVSANPSDPTITGNCGCQQVVVVTYTVGASGGRVTNTVTSDNSTLSPKTSGYNVLALGLVAPTSGSRAVVHNRQPIIQAVFEPNATTMDTTRTVLTWRGVNVTNLARQNHGLLEWEVDSTHWLNIGDSAQAVVTACVQYANHCGMVSTWVVLLNDQKPVLGFSGMPLEALGRQFRTGFGPGLSLRGGDVETSFGMPAYYSMGSPRSAGLVYSTQQSYPRVLVPIDLELPWPNGTPDKVHLTMFDVDGTRLDSLVVSAPGCLTGAVHRCRAVLQGDFSGGSYATPTRKWLKVQAQVDSGTTTQISTDSVEIVVVDRRNSPYGSGWWPAGIPKLVGAGNDRVLVGADGATDIYRGNGDSVYLAPPGNVTVLQKAGSTWTISPRGSPAKLVFDNAGRLNQTVDVNGNATTVAYNGASDQITSITDPVSKAITFGYNSSGKLSTLTDPASRVTKDSIDASNRLVYDSVSSGTTKPFTTTYVYQTYPGTNTDVLTARIGVISDSTVVTYDSAFVRRPRQVTLPQVQDENGNAVKPTITYAAYERQGYGAFVSLNSTTVQLTDPRGNWTRSLLNRWGETRTTVDTLDTLARASYTPEGLVLWSEGKVRDSSRVYSAYDGCLRLARTYIVRSPTDTLRLDSLVYDANHRVIQEIDSRNQTTSFSYDSKGNLLLTTDPAGNLTRFWYHTNGLLDSTRAPGNTKSRWFLYDATWTNRWKTFDESGTMVDSVVFDNVGRDSMHLSKLRVQQTATGPIWQWRTLSQYYSIANQLNSTLLVRSDNCANPCTSPPSFVVDTLHAQRVGYLYDRAGRDSIRLSDRGVASNNGTLYIYDRLGRVLSRHPWTGSLAVRDTFFYDVVGNVKKVVSRRGDTFTTNYDSRNRDTLAVIPGVGTVQKAYAGPGDQLTRAWVANPVDSIGGINMEVRWGYDQRGRLKADTSYLSSTAEGMSYSYDSKERLATWTDALGGVWSLRYETQRGFVDSLLTPSADTITYTFDARSRAVGPYIQSGGAPLQSRVPTWDQTGSLNTLTHTVSTATAYTALKFDRQESLDDPQPTEAPIWTEQDGSGQPAKTMQDSVVYDGWGRVTTWLAFVNGSVVARDSVTFDRAGNIWTTAGAEAYDTTTDRLVSRAGGGCGTWQYTYDPMGDLIQAACGSPASITWTYGYDAARHLRTVTYNGTLVARYAYDVLGRRIAKRVYSNISGGIVAFTRFVYHRADVAFETDSSGSTGLRYTWGPATDDLLAIDDGSAHYLVVEDLLHSVRGLIRRDGTWIRAIRYKMYGATLRDTVSTVAPTWTLRYQWTGREYDGETGWYFFRARYYDPNVRRFVQEDPIGYGGGGNLYAYAAGGPLAARDPSGTKLSGDIDSCVGGNWNCPIRITTHGNLGYSDNWWENMDLQMQADDAVWSALDLQEVEKAIAEAQAELAIVLDSWQSQSRPLSDSENKALVSICESGFYCSDVHVTTGADNIFLDGCGGCSGITVGYNIYFRAPGDPSIPELAHELTHVWQFKQVFDENLVVYGEAFIGLHAWSQLTGQNPYHLDYPLKNLNWSSYGLEQQARIVQDCYASKANACSVSPWQP